MACKAEHDHEEWWRCYTKQSGPSKRWGSQKDARWLAAGRAKSQRQGGGSERETHHQIWGVPERKPHHQTTGGGSAMASGPKKREMVQCKTKNRNRASPQKYTSGRPWSNADNQTLSRLGSSRRRGGGGASHVRDPD